MEGQRTLMTKLQNRVTDMEKMTNEILEKLKSMEAGQHGLDQVRTILRVHKKREPNLRRSNGCKAFRKIISGK